MNDIYCLIITNKQYSDNYISRRNCSYKYILRKNGPLGEIILNTNNRTKIKMMINTIGLKIIRVTKSVYNHYVYLKPF